MKYLVSYDWDQNRIRISSFAYPNVREPFKTPGKGCLYQGNEVSQNHFLMTVLTKFFVISWVLVFTSISDIWDLARKTSLILSWMISKI